MGGKSAHDEQAVILSSKPLEREREAVLGGLGEVLRLQREQAARAVGGAEGGELPNRLVGPLLRLPRASAVEDVERVMAAGPVRVDRRGDRRHPRARLPLQRDHVGGVGILQDRDHVVEHIGHERAAVDMPIEWPRDGLRLVRRLRLSSVGAERVYDPPVEPANLLIAKRLDVGEDHPPSTDLGVARAVGWHLEPIDRRRPGDHEWDRHAGVVGEAGLVREGPPCHVPRACPPLAPDVGDSSLGDHLGEVVPRGGQARVDSDVAVGLGHADHNN